MDGKAQEPQASTAIITGVTGQDGHYLAKQLISLGYQVIGLLRPSSQRAFNLSHLAANDARVAGVEYKTFEIANSKAWQDLLASTQPREIYHLAGVSFVPDSWKDPVGTIESNTCITAKILEAVRLVCPTSRLFYASSSEVFGRSEGGAQNEQTPMRPVSPYGVTKAASQQLVDVYRRQYGLFACSGILFNHESPRRPESFVTRKISAAAAAIATGQQDTLMLGNIESRRDWGYAADFVDCMWRMLQADEPRDYVIGTGIHTTIRELLDYAFGSVGLDWQRFVTTDPRFARANDVFTPLADPSAAWRDLHWKATTDIRSLIDLMVQHDLRRYRHAQPQRKAA